MTRKNGPTLPSPLARLALGLALCLGLGLALTACDRPVADEPGVVAKVNGSPIRLEEVQFAHDSLHMDGGEASIPSVARLRQEFGGVLAELIVQKLVKQALKAKNLKVTDEEADAAEATVKADYPPGAFDRMVADQYIDMGRWRDMLRYRLGVEKLQQAVLRPQTPLSPEEAEAYYRDHVQDFTLPARLRVLVLRGPTRESVERGVELFRFEKSPEAMAAKLSQLEIREVRLRVDQIPDPWKKPLSTLKNGQATSVQSNTTGFEALILLDESPARVLKPAQAYTVIERILVEQKLQEAFGRWLDEELAKADIQVSRHLLPRDEPEDGPRPNPASGNRTSPGLANATAPVLRGK